MRQEEEGSSEEESSDEDEQPKAVKGQPPAAAVGKRKASAMNGKVIYAVLLMLFALLVCRPATTLMPGQPTSMGNKVAVQAAC